MDAESSVRRFLSRELGERGYEVCALGDSRAAIERLKREPFDIVVTDIRMPSADGLDVARAARAHLPDCDVILMTGFASVETAAEGLRLGASDYLLKPFVDIELLVASLDRAVQQQKLRAETDQLRSRLVHSDRLAAIGQLAAGAAHEINNPAAFILANIDCMKRRIEEIRGGQEVQLTELLDEFDEILTENLSGMRRIESLADALGTFARMDQTDVNWVSMTDIIDSVVSIVRCHVRHRARLETDLEDVTPIVGQRGRLAQVVVNLMINAAQAITDDTGTAGRIRVSTRMDGDTVVVAVEDNGHGMQDSLRRRIFDPFFTTKTPEEGTGLGLSLSMDVARAHGGTIVVRSEPMQGSTFELRLPKDTGLQPERSDRTSRHSWPGYRVRLLLVDDEPALLQAYRRMFANEFEVEVAASGAEALEVLQADQSFDLIICDVVMPDIDGIKFREALVEQMPQLVARTIFISGGPVDERHREFVKSLPEGIIEKPIDPTVLRMHLRQTLVHLGPARATTERLPPVE